MERMKPRPADLSVEIKGMDDPKDNKDVESDLSGNGLAGAGRQGRGPPRHDPAISKDPRWQCRAWHDEGRVITTTFDLNLLGDPIWIPEFHFKQARMLWKCSRAASRARSADTRTS